MSKIDELIQEYCPKGVEYMQLGDVAQILNGYSFKSSKYSKEGIRVVRISDVQKGKMSDKDLKFYPLEYEDEISRYLLKENDLVMSLTGNVGRVAMLSKSDLPAGLNQRVACIRPKDTILTRWLFHFLDTNVFESEAMKNSTGGGQKNMSTVWLSKYKVPLPPLEVQKEIVDILDKFTQLEAVLLAELDARRKQYEYYRHHLLDIDATLPRIAVGDVCTVFNGYAFKSSLFNTEGQGIPLIRIRDVNSGFSGTYYSGKFDSKYVVKDRDILIGMDGDFRAIRWANGDALLNQRVCRLQDFDEHIDPAFIFYIVRDAILKIQASTQASTVKHLSSKQIGNIKIPLLPLEGQKRISSVLDKFDLLVSGSADSIPAEIATRRMQYEYYRTKLLAFQELSI